MIAGLEKPDEGVITFHGEAWVDTKEGIFLPPRRRQVGYVFQEYSLFPHLTVHKNVTFAAADPNAADELMKLFGIWHLRNEKPWRISGGERQRCAICQNLARNPRVLLLDEPFSALDADIRRRLRHELKSLKERTAFPILHVTHDLTEALVLGDEILPVVLGKIAKGWLRLQIKKLLEDQAWASRVARELGSLTHTPP
jgi:molybdate transport system ATP-binding protein